MQFTLEMYWCRGKSQRVEEGVCAHSVQGLDGAHASVQIMQDFTRNR